MATANRAARKVTRNALSRVTVSLSPLAAARRRSRALHWCTLLELVPMILVFAANGVTGLDVAERTEPEPGRSSRTYPQSLPAFPTAPPYPNQPPWQPPPLEDSRTHPPVLESKPEQTRPPP